MAAILFAAAAAQPGAAPAEPSKSTGALRAEIQIGLCAPAGQIVRALDLNPRGGPIKVWLFDDEALTLFASGVRLRVRVTADGRSELTLKVADQDCALLDPKSVPPTEGRCEYDLHGAHTAGAVSLIRRLGAKNTSDLLAGRIAVEQVLGPSQIHYLRDILGAWPLPPGLRRLGPTEVRTYRTGSRLYDIDVARLPGGEEFVEISRKVPLADATRAKDALEADLSRAGVPMCADQSAQAVNKLRALLRGSRIRSRPGGKHRVGIRGVDGGRPGLRDLVRALPARAHSRFGRLVHRLAGGTWMRTAYLAMPAALHGVQTTLFQITRRAFSPAIAESS